MFCFLPFFLLFSASPLLESFPVHPLSSSCYDYFNNSTLGPMDPLSIGLGVAGLAPLVAGLGRRIWKWISSFVNAPRTLEDIALRLSAVSSLLLALESEIDDREVEGVREGKLTSRVQNLVLRIREILKEARGWVPEDSANHLQRAKWVFREAKMHRCLANIDVVKAELDLTVNIMRRIMRRKPVSVQPRALG